MDSADWVRLPRCPGTFDYALSTRYGPAAPVLDTDMGSSAKQCTAKGPSMPLFDFGGILTWTQHLWNFYVRRPPATGEDADTDVVADLSIVFLLRPQHRHGRPEFMRAQGSTRQICIRYAATCTRPYFMIAFLLHGAQSRTFSSVGANIISMLGRQQQPEI